jgi:hypothetical protein
MNRVIISGGLMLALGWAALLASCSGDPHSGGRALTGAPDAGVGMGAVTAQDAAAAVPIPDGATATATPPVVHVVPAVTDAGPPSGDGAVPSCASSSAMAMTMRQGADIIFAVDSSGSMDEEIVFVQENLNRFSQQIVMSGVDARVIMLADQDDVCVGAPLGSGGCPADSNPPRYIHVDEKVGSNDALNVYVDSFPSYRAHLRPGTRKVFVVISDDDATDGPNNSAAAFRAAVQQLDATLFADWAYSGIFCFDECDDAAAIGTVHAELVRLTGGVSGDLCLQDFAPVFDQLAKAIITGAELACEWDIPAPPAGGMLDLGSVNVRYLDSAGSEAKLGKVSSAADCPNFKNGWYYDNEQAPTKILACPQTCTSMRESGVSKVEVLFGCKSEPPPAIL